ncbi:MAG: hypothetical protein LQ345_005266 [Seirophora villosa]|nr:MAG: hypothetical protein LQ345_005266 [Seirophora villosa]
MLSSIAILALAIAAYANPVALPQGVTAVISPSAPAPPGCTPSASGSFGIAVQNVSTSAPVARRQATQLSDGQPQVHTMATASELPDGQIQAGMHTMMMMPAAQIGDGQVQAPAATTTYAPVTVIADGQPQAPSLPTSSAAPVTQIGDAQPQAPTTAAPSPVVSSTAQVSASTRAPESSSPGSIRNVACKSEGTLALTLADGVLKDAQGRTGYIADNFQFQFDAPPQTGALITSGFSACGNGTLALGGTNVFYQCLSGDFYNLYDRSWAPQCSPITINLLELQDCS